MPVKNPTDTTAQITHAGATGAVLVPTTVLSRREAELVRDYKVFLEARQLQEELYCPSCFQSGQPGATIKLGENQVGILCPDRLLFYTGPLAPAARFDDLLATPPPVLTTLDRELTLTDVIPEERLLPLEAQLLRAYREFLEKHHLREAVTCTTCWANGQSEGCRSYVTPDAVGIICRHRRLMFIGQTL